MIKIVMEKSVKLENTNFNFSLIKYRFFEKYANNNN